MSTAEQTIATLVAQFYGAVFAQDYELAATFLAEDAELHEPTDLPYGGVHRGPDELLNVFQTVAPMVDPATISMEAFLENDDRGVAIAISRAVTGEELKAAEEFMVRDGKITRIRVFLYDLGPMIRAHAAVHGG